MCLTNLNINNVLIYTFIIENLDVVFITMNFYIFFCEILHYVLVIQRSNT